MSELQDGPLCADNDPSGVEEPQPAAPPPPPVSPVAPVLPEEEPPGSVPARGGCRTELRGWAGAHLHGAVRPRRRAAGRGRPPGRWC
jgi:hypothetical protein